MAVSAGAIAIAVAVAVALAATRGNESPGPGRPSEGVYRGSEPPGRNTLPDFRLPTYDGKVVAARELRGRVVVTTFVDTACKEACPIIVTTLGNGLRRLNPRERRAVTAIAFSVDPAVDSPRHVRAFLRARHAEHELEYAVAPQATMRPVWKAFYVLPAVDTGNADTHSADVRIFDRKGVWVSTLHAGVDLTPQNLAHDVREALKRS
jgi:cytochrome oxidase Cu insertion factor (SCO1/SenC/PrrC family)